MINKTAVYDYVCTMIEQAASPSNDVETEVVDDETTPDTPAYDPADYYF